MAFITRDDSGSGASQGEPGGMLTGEFFVQEGLITDDQLNYALNKQIETGSMEPVARTLVTLGYITEQDRVRTLGKMWGVPFADIAEMSPPHNVLALLSPKLAKKYKSIPFERVGNRLSVAMSNPLDVFAIDELRMVTGLEVEPFIAVEEEVTQALLAHYKIESNMSEALTGILSDFNAEHLEIRKEEHEEISEAELRELGEDAPIVKIANMIVSQAVQDGASDIHIEPQRDGIHVRYRVDGVMFEGMKLPFKAVAPLTSRFKIMSQMDIAEKRVPQDNRISAIISGKEFDFRVSTLPVIYGEKIVMRVLDKSGINVGLAKLGLLPGNLAKVEAMCSRSYGIILVTGPTGSGKSTTLYSMLNRLKGGGHNIITIEDPVEYELPGINQCGVNNKAGMTFGVGLRAMLRQDPDVIMVGEMRDNETATIAMQAALTGHLVLSTLHTNDAPSAATRLIDMDVEPFLISSSIIGVLAQRLARTICPGCKVPYKEPLKVFETNGFNLPSDTNVDQDGKVTLYRGSGCNRCKGSGYKGRTGIHELMEITDQVRDKILEKSSSHSLRQVAVEAGMSTLLDDALAKVTSGVTTIEEVVRVIYA